LNQLSGTSFGTWLFFFHFKKFQYANKKEIEKIYFKIEEKYSEKFK